MGYIDKTITTLKCDCGNEESQKILDKGNMYKINQWQQYNTWKNFDCVMEDENTENQEPFVKAAKCKECGNSANIDIKH